MAWTRRNKHDYDHDHEHLTNYILILGSRGIYILTLLHLLDVRWMHPRAFFSLPRGAFKPSSVLHETAINENLESTVLAPPRPYIYCPKGPYVTWTTHTHISKLYSLLFSPGKKSKLHMNRKFVIIVKMDAWFGVVHNFAFWTSLFSFGGDLNRGSTLSSCIIINLSKKRRKKKKILPLA